CSMRCSRIIEHEIQIFARKIEFQDRRAVFFIRQ
ncbi:MAG: hypothetical protein ACI8X3_003270, partial [Saprospiraceae bacterium]